MLETMYVRCTHCGYDNSPEYRFCGMCGASLAHPPVVTKTATKDMVAEKENGHDGAHGNPESVHGPSFLGLAEDPKTEFHYLYEDEQPRSHAGAIFVVILLLAAGGFGYWQWRHNGFPFNRLGGTSTTTQSASPSEVAPAQSQDQQTHIDHPMTGVGDVLPTEQNNQNKQPDAAKNSEATPQGEQPQNPASPNPASDSKAQANNASEAPAERAEEKPAVEAKATPPPSISEKHGRKPKTPAPKPAAPKTEAAATAAKAAPDADLELAGEKYLYGTGGARQNCARAESSLRTAATHGNSKAQTVLGTMYATGHCVGRDLPTAYRWFARALHQEPQNTRISADLQVLWRQMSAQERQLATSNER